MNIVAYCRYSSENQRQESIEAQVRAIEAYCTDNNHNIIEVYVDEAKSATTDQRPAFQRMITDSDQQTFEAVIVHKLDRFARDRYDSIFYRRKLKNNNIKLISVTEKLDGSPESVILESMLEGISEYYSRNLSRESMKGLMENAHKCLTTGGKPPFGYTIDPKTKEYLVDENEAFAVRKIFSMYVDGVSYVEIIKWLNDNGFKSKKGLEFKTTSLHSLLNNEKYIGVYQFNRSSRTKYDIGAREALRIDDGVPAIVSIETFEAAQRRLEVNKVRSQIFKAKDLYVLSGKIVCGSCGNKMFGNKRRSSKGTEWAGYLCSGRKKCGCKAKEVKKTTVELAVMNHLENEIFTDSFIDALAEDIVSLFNEKQNGAYEEINILKDQLAKTDRQITNIINAVAEGFASQQLKEKMGQLEAIKGELTVMIETTAAKSIKKIDIEDVKKYLSQGKGITFKSAQDQIQIVDMFLEKVVVHDEYLDIHFYIDNLKKKRGYIGAP